MSTKLKLLVTLLALGVTHAFAQSAAPAKTTVQTKSSEKDGRTTTERTFTTTVTEVAEKPAGVTVAIFTANRAGADGANELGALEDYITGKVTELNVRVISGETALNAVAGMAPGAQANAHTLPMQQPAVVAALHQEHAGVRQVVHIQKLAPRRAAAPDHVFGIAA